MPFPVKIWLFGGLRVQIGERSITRFRSKRAAELLAYLAYFRPERHTREDLTDLLWPDLEPEAGRWNLRRELSALRRQLEEMEQGHGAILVADRTSVGLNPETVTTDVAEFKAILARLRRAYDANTFPILLARLQKLYAQTLLPDIYTGWVHQERSRLALSLQTALQAAARNLTESSRQDEAILLAQERVALDPFAEEAHLHLIRLLLQAGNAEVADQQKQVATRLLLPETPDTNPGKPSPALPPPSPRVTGFPLYLGRFVGREKEVGYLLRLLGAVGGEGARASARLITLLAPGGCGKTRLATEAARQSAYAFPGGVVFVSLAELDDPRLLLSHLNARLGLATQNAELSLEALVTHFDKRGRTLLVLDNLEQLLLPATRPEEDATGQVLALLGGASQLVCLVTSREALRVEGEWEIPLAPLSLPTHTHQSRTHLSPERLREFSAIALFEERAQAVQPDFRLTARNAAEAVTLCQRLDGLPLAIEIAAAWLGGHSVAWLNRQLDTCPDFLTSRRRHPDARHQSVRQSVAWSVERLAPAERRLLEALSCFRGGWSPEAAEALAEENKKAEPIERRLAHLAARSLIVGEGDHGRYRMLETVRATLQDDLPPERRALLEARHATYFGKWAHSVAGIGQQALTREQQDALREELPNLHKALKHLLSTQRSEEAARLTLALHGLWCATGERAEEIRWLERVLEQEARISPAEIRFELWSRRSAMALGTADFAAAKRSSKRALAISAELREAAPGAQLQCLSSLVSLCFHTADYAGAGRHGEAALAILEAEDSAALGCYPVIQMGELAQARGDLREARRWYERALGLFGARGDALGVAEARQLLGILDTLCGDFPAARRHLEASLLQQEAYGREIEKAICQRDLGALALLEGEYEQAYAYLRHALACCQERENAALVADIGARLGQVALAEGNLPVAERAVEESLRYWQEQRHPRWSAGMLRLRGEIALHRGQIPAAREHLLKSIGLYRQVRDRYGEAHSQRLLAAVASQQRQRDEARTALQDAIAYFISEGVRPALIRCLDVAAALTDSPMERDALLGAAQGQREAIGFPQTLPERALWSPLHTTADTGVLLQGGTLPWDEVLCLLKF